MVTCCEERMAYEAKRLGIPHSEMQCLQLFKGEKYLTIKGISQRMDLTKSRVSKIVDGLSQKSLVTRTDDPNDARSKLIGLTPAGLKKSDEIQNVLRDNHRKVLERLTPEERKRVLSALDILRASMEEVKLDREEE